MTLLLVFLALAAPWLAPADPTAQNLPDRLAGPSAAHWMGTDELGRDILSRILFGARISMLGQHQRRARRGNRRACDRLAGGLFRRLVRPARQHRPDQRISFLSRDPSGHCIRSVSRPGRFGKVILALIMTGWAGYARLARAQILQAKEMEYVLAARSLGASPARILLRHLLPNILQPVLVQATIGMAGAILAESTLSFLGVGVLAPMPSWGGMLNDARGHLFDAPHLVLFPALAVMAAVLAFNLLGDALRDWMDPRMRSYSDRYVARTSAGRTTADGKHRYR